VTSGAVARLGLGLGLGRGHRRSSLSLVGVAAMAFSVRGDDRRTFVTQRRADASAALTSAAEAGAAGWVLYWSSLVTA
jgi:hypothetical protein